MIVSDVLQGVWRMYDESGTFTMLLSVVLEALTTNEITEDTVSITFQFLD